MKGLGRAVRREGHDREGKAGVATHTQGESTTYQDGALVEVTAREACRSTRG